MSMDTGTDCLAQREGRGTTRDGSWGGAGSKFPLLGQEMGWAAPPVCGPWWGAHSQPEADRRPSEYTPCTHWPSVPPAVERPRWPKPARQRAGAGQVCPSIHLDRSDLLFISPWEIIWVFAFSFTTGLI